jgi:hypothetical protein
MVCTELFAGVFFSMQAWTTSGTSAASVRAANNDKTGIKTSLIMSGN